MIERALGSAMRLHLARCLAAAMALAATADPYPPAPPSRWRPPERPEPSLEVLLPLGTGSPGPCADRSRYPSGARLQGLDRLELETGGEFPPADLGC